MAHFAATVREDGNLELPQAARQLVKPGQIVYIDLPDNTTIEPTQPNTKMLASLEKIAKRQEGRPESDGTRTLEFLHEGRDEGPYDETEAIEGIRRGLEQMQRGEGRPTDEVFAEFRAKHNLANG